MMMWSHLAEVNLQLLEYWQRCGHVHERRDVPSGFSPLEVLAVMLQLPLMQPNQMHENPKCCLTTKVSTVPLSGQLLSL